MAPVLSIGASFTPHFRPIGEIIMDYDDDFKTKSKK
jgi:hypothetical protein